MASDDRRRYSRVEFHFDSFVKSGNIIIPARLYNLSLRGALVVMEQEFEEDTCTLTIKLSDTIELNIECECVRHATNELGLRFISFGMNDLEHLRSIIELNTGDSERVLDELEHLAEDNLNEKKE